MNINATLFVQMAVFFVGAWITMKFIWPPLNRAIEERQKKIADGLAAADRGEHALEEAKKEGASHRSCRSSPSLRLLLLRAKSVVRLLSTKPKNRLRSKPTRSLPRHVHRLLRKSRLPKTFLGIRLQIWLCPELPRSWVKKSMLRLTSNYLTNLRRNCNHGRDLNYRTSLCRSVA